MELCIVLFCISSQNMTDPVNRSNWKTGSCKRSVVINHHIHPEMVSRSKISCDLDPSHCYLYYSETEIDQSMKNVLDVSFFFFFFIFFIYTHSNYIHVSQIYYNAHHRKMISLINVNFSSKSSFRKTYQDLLPYS